MQYKKPTKKQIIIRTLIIFLLLSIAIGLNVVNMTKMKHYMFENILSFDFTKEYIVETIEKDDNLRELVPAEKYTNVIKYKGKKYEVYAYVFDNTDKVKEYYERTSGAVYTAQYGWHMNGNSVTYMQYVVYCKNALLYVKGNNSASDLINFLNWLTEEFPLYAHNGEYRRGSNQGTVRTNQGDQSGDGSKPLK